MSPSARPPSVRLPVRTGQPCGVGRQPPEPDELHHTASSWRSPIGGEGRCRHLMRVAKIRDFLGGAMRLTRMTTRTWMIVIAVLAVYLWIFNLFGSYTGIR